jgi:hypothetical protein
MTTCLNGKISHLKEMSTHIGEKQFSHEEKQSYISAERFEAEEMTVHIDGKTSHSKEMSAHIGEKQFGCREKHIDIGGKRYDVEEITSSGNEKYFDVEGISDADGEMSV